MADKPVEGGEKKLSKKELRILERQQQTAKSAAGGEDADPSKFGDAPLIQSVEITNRCWVKVSEINESLAGQTVWVRARLHTSRGKGKCAFLVLREQYSTVQAVVFQSDTIPKGMVKYASNISKESMIDVEALVSVVQTPVESVSQKTVELAVQKLFTISPSINLPFQIEDASRPDPEFEKPDCTYVRVNPDTRLDSRFIDLRTPANLAIMKIQHGVGQLFREFLLKEGFIEIHSPKLIAGSSEGGASVFRFKYFDLPACLAQSPQLAKQMAIMSDLERVFEIGPVFRAEDSNTHRHLCEFVGLDMEMAINEHYFEILDVLNDMFLYIFDGLTERYAKELATINAQHPFEPLQYSRPTLRLTFPEAIAMLRGAGVTIDDLQDLSTPDEKLLGRLVKEKYGTDFFMLHRYPTVARPFYTMPCPDDGNYTNSFDFFIRGEEIVSGAQRIHDPAMLNENARNKGIDVATIKDYIDSFRYGAPPHGGCGVGLERVTMLYLGTGNIRKTSMFPRDPKRLTP